MTQEQTDKSIDAAISLVQLAALLSFDLLTSRGGEQVFKYSNITVYSQEGIVTRVEPAGVDLAEPLQITEAEITRALGTPLARIAITPIEVRLVYSNISLWLNKAKTTCYKITATGE
jgi:hypothetical protein